MQLLDAYKSTIEEPAESFRVEVTMLYLEMIIGMQSIGPDIPEQINQCMQKIEKLYGNKDMIPLLNL